MNWTEGSLNRHAKGKGWKEDSARQRQHFARARARAVAPADDAAKFLPTFIQGPPDAGAQDDAGAAQPLATPRDGAEEQPPEGGWEAKRDRLLGRRDWAGLGPSNAPLPPPRFAGPARTPPPPPFRIREERGRAGIPVDERGRQRIAGTYSCPDATGPAAAAAGE
ncbi:hypothetical protein CDD83_1644 [Cordyceps sp. RAO-2017]|nr:hypothetical protein CDD83_1644 [Cordyceps sp. RAO-2017]